MGRSAEGGRNRTARRHRQARASRFVPPRRWRRLPSIRNRLASGRPIEARASPAGMMGLLRRPKHRSGYEPRPPSRPGPTGENARWMNLPAGRFSSRTRTCTQPWQVWQNSPGMPPSWQVEQVSSSSLCSRNSRPWVSAKSSGWGMVTPWHSLHSAGVRATPP